MPLDLGDATLEHHAILSRHEVPEVLTQLLELRSILADEGGRLALAVDVGQKPTGRPLQDSRQPQQPAVRHP